MKNKSTIILLILLLIGLLIGSLIGEIFSDLLPFLNKSQQITWEPKADFNILQFDIFIKLKINIASVIGLFIAIWLYRKL